MRNALKYLIITIIAAVVCFCLGGTLWLVGTTAGARWLIAAVSHKPGLIISAKSVEGRLAGTLMLDHLSMEWPEGNVRVDQAEMTTSALAALIGEISIQNLALKNIVVTDNAPDKPPVLKWPRASVPFSWFDAEIKRLNAENVTYRHREEKPLHIGKIEASAEWRKGYLAVNNIRLVADPGVVSGNILAGFSRPLLEMSLVAAPSRPLAGIEYFHLSGKFTPGKKREQIAGNLLLSGNRRAKDSKPLWVLALSAAMTDRGFPISNVRLSRPEKNGLITADGMLTFSGTQPSLSLRASATDLDWLSDVHVPVNLSGTLTLNGTVKQYSGSFAFLNRGEGWPSVKCAGDYSGGREAAIINITRGSALKGSLSGRLALDWRSGIMISGALSGRNLDPAVLDKKWAGQINFDLTGRMTASGTERTGGEVTLLLMQSHLHGRALTGELHAALAGDEIQIRQLALTGKGFQLQAAGALKRKLDFTARISDFSLLLPQAAGSLAADGWVRRQDGKISGAVSARAAGLTLNRLQTATVDLKASLADNGAAPLKVNVAAHKLHYGQFHADTFTLEADGTRKKHTVAAALRSGRYEANLAASGSYRDRQWQGRIIRLDGKDKVGPWRLIQPVEVMIAASGLQIDPLLITGVNSESIKASCRLTKAASSGFISLDWNGLRLDRLASWLDQDIMTGFSRGNLQVTLAAPQRIKLSGKAFLSGTLNIQGKPVGIRRGEFTLDGDEHGARANIRVSMTEGGTLQGDFSSAAPAGLSLPEEGRFHLQLQELDMALLTAVLPGKVKAEGKIAGNVDGRLLPGERFMMTGLLLATRSRLFIQQQKNQISIGLRQASLDWSWRDESLGGNLALTLAESGKLQGRFRLPLAARWPVKMDQTGKILASLAGKIGEKGALSSLFPGLIQESRGELDVDLQIAGIWQEPLFGGTARLSKAGGYIPSAGITIKDASADVRLNEDSIRVDSFRVASGPGYLEGSALLRIEDGQVAGFEGRLQGDRFQTIYFPELQMQISPQIVFSGTPGKLVVQGDVLLPEIRISAGQSRGPIEASSDVVRKGRTKPTGKKLPFDLDAKVKLILGDSVYFNAAGINARLGGSIDLQFKELEKIKSSGEIRILKGSFQAYGVNLDITRGRLYYLSAPFNNPTLDILALRKVEDVRVGVSVSGTLQNPLIKLYSEPPMQDTDILAYIVLGHPMSGDTDQAAILAAAAGALLTSRQAEELQGQIKGRLGLGSFDISAGVMEQSGKMGYKPIKLPSGRTGTAKSQDVGETMVVVGRYLTPGLYISYGRSIFTGTNLFSLRYNLSKNWQVESYTGDASGADIYYKLEFN